MSSNQDQIERLLDLFLLDDYKIESEITSFCELKYNAKINEKCKYCSNKPTKVWKIKNKKIKVCNKCCEKHRNTFHILY